ncbi:hypothetical protein BU15DRAFT_57848 [Melanogaster broomeanus]|nr:hypothetical protein BU15DRAFT_57848 [Melanogaster broomeanus]
MSSVIIQQTPAWQGFASIKYMMVLGHVEMWSSSGDSYSAVGYSPESHPHPTPSNPLGIPFPGHTYATQRQGWISVGPEQPNWVGHLLTKYLSGTNYVEGTKQRGLDLIPSREDHGAIDSSLVVFDFAEGGDTIAGVRYQILKRFLPHVGVKPDWATWAAEDMTWVGINDCAYGIEPADVVRKLFGDHESLYEAGAGNFLFIDVPPIARSPAAQQFAADHADASVMIFSSWDTFTRILDDPASYGFDADEPYGGIWVDSLHPTTKVHDILGSGNFWVS